MWTSWQVAPGRIAGPAASKYSSYASAIAFVSSDSGVPSAATARETSTQCIPGPATSSDGSTKSPSTSSLRAILNSGSATPGAAGRGQHHVHRQPAAALGDEVLLRDGHHLGGGAAGRVRLGPDLEAAPVDAHRVPDARELGLALHGAGEVELDVERDDVEPSSAR